MMRKTGFFGFALIGLSLGPFAALARAERDTSSAVACLPHSSPMSYDFLGNQGMRNTSNVVETFICPITHATKPDGAPTNVLVDTTAGSYSCFSAQTCHGGTIVFGPLSESSIGEVGVSMPSPRCGTLVSHWVVFCSVPPGGAITGLISLY